MTLDDFRKSLTEAKPPAKAIAASGLAPRHDLSVKLPTFTVKPVHALVFMRIYQKPERLTIAKGFVATKRG